jgi:xylulokinase
VGAGVVESGKMYNVLGTSSWIAGASKEPHFDPEQRTFNWIHLDGDLFNPCGTMQGAGFSYSWFREVLGEADALAAEQGGVRIYELLNEYAESSPVGANGLLFLPYLMGERSPWWNPKARAAFIGLDAAHTRKDMVRAVLEGVALNLKIILDVFEAVEPVDALVLIGGGARNRVWRNILASAWNRPLDVPESVENATSMGAAVCGGVAVGMYPRFDVATRFARPVDRVEPDGQAADDYERLYPVFCNVYRALVPAFDELAAFRRQRTEQKR